MYSNSCNKYSMTKKKKKKKFVGENDMEGYFAKLQLNFSLSRIMIIST